MIDIRLFTNFKGMNELRLTKGKKEVRMLITDEKYNKIEGLLHDGT